MIPDGHLESELGTVQAALTRELERGEKAEAMVERLVAERDAARDQAATAMLDAAAERLKAAVAETEAKGLREALAEARRPFWRRWIGP